MTPLVKSAFVRVARSLAAPIWRGLLGGICAAAAMIAAEPAASAPRITILSSSPKTISGGDVLAKVTLGATSTSGVSIMLNGRDVTQSFKYDPVARAMVGLVTGLKSGDNLIEANGADGGRRRLRLINHPISGPILSGPQSQPFICQTEAFVLPDGSSFGPSSDAACSAPTKVTFVYLSKHGGAFKPLPSASGLPDDVATTTTTAGITVPFVVRVETATINRGIHQNAVLFDPTADRAPTPFAPPKAWNRRLIAVHGVGCPGGWYVQGAAQGEAVLDATRLGEGYVLFNNTLRHPTNSCNALIAGETTMMDKEHVIKTFGVPDFTVSKGVSGGSYTSLQVADAFPGLFDGVLIGSTFPDALSIALSGLDARLLTHYFADHPGFTDQQKNAISGYKSPHALTDAAGQAQRADPVSGRVDIDGYKGAVWNSAVPASLRYDAKSNPRGARPTVFDVARNVYGTDPATGFARRPYDNVGVQYGLAALRAGVIAPEQFVDLNEKIGGYDQDANFVAVRSVGDLGAIRRAQQAGLALSGGGGLASIPVFDTAVGPFLYDEDAGYHYQWFHFAVQERLKQANGDARNHVMWRGGVGMAEILRAYQSGSLSPESKALSDKVTAQSWAAFIQWVTAAKADPSGASQRTRTIRSKPPGLVDGCWTQGTDPQFIAEPQTWGHTTASKCNALYPSYSFVRKEAGGPLAANVYKCRLRTIDAVDRGVTFTREETRRMKAIFPRGVCDFDKPGLAWARVIPQLSAGP
ncbi:MAG TPA: DUF6351 family protein [Caulobacteraceae bacterium]|jgi:hypothetical protein